MSETMTLEARIAEARTRGERAGKNAASWYFNGETTNAQYRYVLRGIEDGDPEVLDMFNPPDLSGQWAGESINELLGDLIQHGGAEGYDEDDDIMDAWESAASDAFWAEIERVCRLHVEG